MNPGRFYVPRIGTNFGPLMGTNYLPTRGSIGLFGRITNSFKSFNWGGLLNGANKTLNVVNQTIPLVRQAGPMLNNMKSVLRIAKAFGSETNRNYSGNINNINKNVINNNIETTSDKKSALNDNNLIFEKEDVNSSLPNFFV